MKLTLPPPKPQNRSRPRVGGLSGSDGALGRGKWLSKDPIGERGGFNLYVLCGNSPVDLTDPLGLCCGLTLHYDFLSGERSWPARGIFQPAIRDGVC